MDQNKIPKREIIFLAVGEIIISAVICAVYLIIQKFSYKVLTGALLGSAVTVFNFLLLSVLINRAIDKCLAGFDPSVGQEVGESDEDNTEEEYEENDSAARFARENASKLSGAIKLSYTVRTLTMVISLVLAFLTKQFDVISTLIPLLAFRPILTLSQIISKKGEK